ncbi:phage tail spike protein [Lysinibacillus piscis]|uniref:Prophage tail endopeptidase domain-containing protein n=1 Tax=Lysinibacillus piscis TaxID=2518931 RepID=A0ABQ5NLT2_9BACI|nr:phage tail spike protein [Lysinibacillus sp. KH24]GLC89323.1 hypothetical protein LYSBPC_24500 [Lysinibacillus sp. KH24]
MLTVIKNGMEYPINHIQSARRDSEISSAHELNLIVVNEANNPGYPFLQDEALILIDGHEYRIKKLTNRTHYKNISALHAVTDLIGVPFNQKLTGSYTPLQVFNQLLAGTDWTVNFDSSGVVANVELKEFGRNNVWKLFQEFCNKIQVEFELLPNKVFNIRKKLSSDYGQQYRYGYNLKSLSKESTSTNIVTHVIVNYGDDLTETATFISPTAGNYSRSIYGDIINDERIKTIEDAEKRAKEKFKDIDISYELDIAQLGESHELGETIHTIYEPMDDLSIVTRILKVREEWDGEEFVVTSATVGNYVFKTAEEILQDQIKDTESSVNDNIDKTKEIIQREYRWELSETVTDLERNITTEYTAMISMTAREIRTEMTQHITNINTGMDSMETRLSSSISQTAAQIRAEVSSEVTTISNNISNVRQDVARLDITASSIQSTVTSHSSQIGGLNTQMSSAQSSITQQAALISQKVSITDYTGASIVSKINQDPYSVTIDAQKINFNGAVFVNGNITGNGSITGATTIDVSSNISIGHQIIFSDMTTITTGGGGLAIEAWNGIDMIGGTNFSGVVDFQNAYVTNLNGFVASSTQGLSITQSTNNPKVMVFRRYGADIGYLTLS